MKVALVIVIIFVGAVALSSWLVMLSVGVVHSIFDWPQTISFWEGTGLAFALTVFGSFFRNTVSLNKSK